MEIPIPKRDKDIQITPSESVMGFPNKVLLVTTPHYSMALKKQQPRKKRRGKKKNPDQPHRDHGHVQ